ncbi:MAG TPA: zf-HC2 domain-containing protein [Pseudonocardiaceae bacterium]|nr:zf-HC2 domain-containing protein [Pseudonocardiaceae bacterium]
MRCTDYRQELSARLDSEDDPDLRVAVDTHLASCPECRQWYEDAARVTRRARMDVVHPAPDLAAAVLARSPVNRRSRWRLVLRAALALVGLGQVALSLAQVLSDGEGGGGAELNGASVLHMAHESAAWNIALGIGFVWIAWRVASAGSLVPTLSAFLTVLTVLTALDVIDGQVAVARLSSHILVLIGYVIMLTLVGPRVGSGGFWPRSRVRDDSWPAEFSGSPGGRHSKPQDEVSDAGSGLRPSARHDAA